MTRREFQLSVLILAVFGMLITPIAAYSYGPGSGQQTQVQQPKVKQTDHSAANRGVRNAPIDVVIGADNTFRGVLTNQAGVPLVGQRVELLANGRVEAQSTTDAKGRFVFRIGQGGLYAAVSKTNRVARLYRLWSPRLAPPAAQSQVLMVADDRLERGQFDPSEAYSWIEQRPVIGYSVLTTAIILPIVLIARRKKS